MSSGNIEVRKYRISFELQLYAGTHGTAYATALEHLADLVEKHRRLQLGAALDLVDDLPNGGVEGAGHGDTLDGWHCVFTVDKVRP